MNIIFVLSSLFALGVIGLILFKETVNFLKLRRIKNPIRQLSAVEKNYLTPYLVQSMKLRDDNVYRVTGGNIIVETVRAQGNTLTYIKFESMEVVFPYHLEAFTKMGTNTIEFVVVNVSFGYLVGMVVSVNSVSLNDVAEVFWDHGEEKNNNISQPNIIAKRSETVLERQLRLSQLWYGSAAMFFSIALICLLAIIYSTDGVGVFLLICAGLFLALTILSFVKTYNKNKHMQEVINITGYLTKLELSNIRKIYDTSSEFYFTPSHHVKFMEKDLKTSFVYFDYDKEVKYTADITADKKAGYQLLSLKPFSKLGPKSSLQDAYKKKSHVLKKRTLLWLCLAIVPLGLIWPYYDRLDILPQILIQGMSKHTPEYRTYTTSQDILDNPPMLGDRIEIRSNDKFSCQITQDRHDAFIPDCSVIVFGSSLAADQLPKNITDIVISGYNRAIANKSMYSNTDYQIVRNNFKDNIEEACAFDAAFDCDEIYAELAEKFDISDNAGQSTDEVELQTKIKDIKSILDQPFLNLDYVTETLLSSKIESWLEDSASVYWQNYFANLSPQVVYKLNQGVVIHLAKNETLDYANRGVSEKLSRDSTKYWINAGNIASSDFSNGTKPYSFEGNVVSVKDKKGQLHIKLSHGDVSSFNKSLALVLLITLSILIGLTTIVSYIYIKKVFKNNH